MWINVNVEANICFGGLVLVSWSANPSLHFPTPLFTVSQTQFDNILPYQSPLTSYHLIISMPPSINPFHFSSNYKLLNLFFFMQTSSIYIVFTLPTSKVLKVVTDIKYKSKMQMNWSTIIFRLIFKFTIM